MCSLHCHQNNTDKVGPPPITSLIACSHCTGPGTGVEMGPGTIDFYIMLCTVHTTSEHGHAQGMGQCTIGLHTHFPVPGPVPASAPGPCPVQCEQATIHTG